MHVFVVAYLSGVLVHVCVCAGSSYLLKAESGLPPQVSSKG